MTDKEGRKALKKLEQRWKKLDTQYQKLEGDTRRLLVTVEDDGILVGDVLEAVENLRSLL